MNEKNIQILLTNDDSIHSPGLWAAAEALDSLGYVHVVAPLYQQTAAGHSMPNDNSGIIEKMTLTINGRDWTVYAVDGSPGQAVLHGVYEIIGSKPDLVVSGINYGENVGANITVSGTVGAALEAATLGIPALATSMRTNSKDHLSLSKDVDFSVAGYFTHKFAKVLLKKPMPEDVDVLKLDVPYGAKQDTPWLITRQSRLRYYFPNLEPRESLSDYGPIRYKSFYEPDDSEKGTDTYVVRIAHEVALTPISLDKTSRTDFNALRDLLDND